MNNVRISTKRKYNQVSNRNHRAEDTINKLKNYSRVVKPH